MFRIDAARISIIATSLFTKKKKNERVGRIVSKYSYNRDKKLKRPRLE